MASFPSPSQEPVLSETKEEGWDEGELHSTGNPTLPLPLPMREGR